MGKWLAGIAATVIGALAIAVLTPLIVKPPPHPRVPPIEGTWQFVRFEGTRPGTGFMTIQPTAISFHRDGSFSASGSVSLGPAGSVDTSVSGSYTPVDERTIKLEQKGDRPGTQIYEYVLAGNELTLAVPGTYSMVFRKA
jgi:hypothetical protein